MKIKDCIAFAKCVRNPDSPLTVDAQTVHGEFHLRISPK